MENSEFKFWHVINGEWVEISQRTDSNGKRVYEVDGFAEAPPKVSLAEHRLNIGIAAVKRVIAVKYHNDPVTADILRRIEYDRHPMVA